MPLQEGFCTEVISAQSKTLVKFFLVSVFLIYVCMFFIQTYCMLFPPNKTEIGLKESQASRGDEQVFVIISLVSDPE